jgi:hypothetical protein
MVRRKMVSTHMRTPVGKDPMARLENLSHSMYSLLIYLIHILDELARYSRKNMYCTEYP